MEARGVEEEGGVGCECRGKGRHCSRSSNGRRVMMRRSDLSLLCAEAPGVYRVSRFLHSDHSRRVAAVLCVHLVTG